MPRVLNLTKNEEKFVSNIKRALPDRLSEGTVKTYVSRLINLKRCLNVKNTTTSFLKTMREEIAECLSKDSLSSQKVSYVALVSTIENKKSKAFKDASKFYTEKYKNINIKIISKAKENKRTPKQKIHKDITFANLRNTVPPKALKDLNENTNLENYTNYIISLLYLRNEYILRLDYHNTELIFDLLQIDDEENQLLIQDDKATMFLNKFKNKTSFEREHGKIRFELNDRLKNEIDEFIQWKEDNDISNDHLFVKSNGKPYSAPGFSNLIKKLMKKYSKVMTLNDIRHKAETDLMKSQAYKDSSFKEKEVLHNKLIHGKEVAEIFYFKKD